jgi:16S rRNA A1518/A1519 N6-dimethyltransferase RsmA/KsgA/DIM1 with predicted DNA glycosylase/AP lyase activity
MPMKKSTLNDYETPTNVAKAMVELIKPTDQFILEPCAGTGQIASLICKREKPWHLSCFEINPYRFEKLESTVSPSEIGVLACGDFLQATESKVFDLVITNPPFDYGMEFIEKGLSVLRDAPNSRLLYLLPVDYLLSQKRAKQFQEMNAHVSAIYAIPGRVDYLKDGVPMSLTQQIKNGIPQFKGKRPLMMPGRQCSDAVFEIKKGKGNNFFGYLEV